MNYENHIYIHWIGVRKDAGRGSVWGYFTEIGKPNKPHNNYSNNPGPIPACYILRGSIGKKLQIIKTDLTDEFLLMAAGIANNFKEKPIEKVIPRWGKVFNEELEMFLTMVKLRG